MRVMAVRTSLLALSFAIALSFVDAKERDDVDLHQMIKELQAKQLVTENKLRELEKLTIYQGKHIRKLELQQQVANRSTRQLAGEGSVAFTAYLDHDVTFANQQTIKFNQVITNEGGGYNSHSGVFTCPMNGMYFFSFSVGSRGATEADARLIVNSAHRIDAFAEGDHGTDDQQGSNSAVLRLNQGDVVWVDGVRSVHSTPDWRVTSFMGFYLFP